jgi:hypothetical protein
MAVLLDEDGFVPPLEEVTGPFVVSIEELGIDAVKLPHAKRQVSVGCFDEEMIVVVHEAVGVAYPIVSFVDAVKGVEESLTVMVVLKYGLLFVSA